MDNEKRIRPSALIRGYFVFPSAICFVLLLMSIYLFFFVDKTAGTISFAVFIAYLIALIIFITVNKKIFVKNLAEFGREFGFLEGEFIKDFPIPYAAANSDGELLLYNNRFAKFIDEIPGGINIVDLFKELRKEDLEFDEPQKSIAVTYNGRNYRLQFKKMSLDKDFLKSNLFTLPNNADFIYTAFLFDETEIINLVKKCADEQLVIGTLYIDSFDETLEHVPDVKKSLLIALVDRGINNYFLKINGVVRKIEKDKFFIIFKRKYLSGLQRSKFELLDEIKAIDAGNEIPVTVSMGIGVSEDYGKALEFSRQGVELALGRGGDQVVVKNGERNYFYGGKTKQVEKNTRVKARITTLALKEVILGKENVVIMGHKSIDPDAFGAAVGLYRAATALGKRANIVLDNASNMVTSLLKGFKEDGEYIKNEVFLNKVEAEAAVDENTVLIVVDANRPSVFEHPQLLNKTKSIVLIDHHLQSGDKIDSIVLNYVEPTASSASEMVSEILQYIADDVKLKKIEAEALYAGILIDTNYFSKNTGVRTFEAAAFLRKAGVDVAKVKGMFNNSLEDIKAKAMTLQNAEVISPGFVFAECPSKGVLNPTIIAAQSANDLLDVKDVVGSFVAVSVGTRIFISARSVGNVNVQLVMERLGGGGHLNMAGSQMDGVTMEEAKSRIKNTVIKMRKEGTL